MSRRGSTVNTSTSKKKEQPSYDNSKRRQSSLTGSVTRSSITSDTPLSLKDGDVFYKTIRHFPSVMWFSGETTVSVTNKALAGSEGYQPQTSRGEKSASGDRRGSGMMTWTREDTMSPSEGINSPGFGKDSYRGQGAEKKSPIVVWPEWSDGDISSEKWDVATKGKQDKGKTTGAQQQYFDDPEGKIELPHGLHVETWKRPGDMTLDKPYVVVDPEGFNAFDLLTTNDHLFESELMRWIVGQIIALWQTSEIKPDGAVGFQPIDPTNPALGEYTHSWRPWEHIYAMKVIRGPNMPTYNPSGKYVLKLYWLGSWRKVIVDDSIPYDEHNRPLLPTTTLHHELWPLILAKGLIKIASLDYSGGNPNSEFGDFSVVHALTSWIPECIPLQTTLMMDLWNLIKCYLPDFKLPEPKSEEVLEPDPATFKLEAPAPANHVQEGEAGKDKSTVADKVDPKAAADKKDKKADEKKKDEKKEKTGKEKEKEKTKERSMMMQDDTPVPEHPEVVIFASYNGPPKLPLKVSTLRDMANASETLRQRGLSHLYPHPILLTQTRSCPLEPPTPPEVVPKWKLIRPKKKRVLPSDEPKEEIVVVEKPIMSVQINSPFINYKVSPIPIPTDIHRPASMLERGQSHSVSRPGTANVETIEENDEVITEAVEPEFPIPAPATPVPSAPPSPDQTEAKEAVEKGKGANGKLKKKSSGTSQVSAPSGKSKLSTVGGRDSGLSLHKSGLDGKTHDKAVRGSKVGEDLTMAQDQPMNGSNEELGIVEDHHDHTISISETQSTELWMDFDEFCRCFKNLYIYHKPNTYQHNQKFLDMKSIASVKEGRKTNPGTALQSGEEKSPQFLFVDSLKSTELIFAYTALSRWPETASIPKEDSRVDLKGGKKLDKAAEKEAKMDAQTTDSGSIVLGHHDHRPVEKVHPGLVTAEPYSWKSLVTGQPILRIRCSGIKSAALQLPPGRHVLKISMTAPLAYHLHVCSTTLFLLGDEDKVMQEITKESCRFVDTAQQLMSTLGKCIAGFHDGELFKTAWEEFFSSHCPYRSARHMSMSHHWKVFMESFYNVLKKCMHEGNLATPEMAHAWRTLFFDMNVYNPLGLTFGSSSRPTTGAPPVPDRGSAKGPTTKQPKGTKRDQPEPKLDQWKNREPTAEEHVAAIKIQKTFRGFRVRKVCSGRTPGTEDNLKEQETMMKAWTQVLEAKTEEIGLAIFRGMFKAEPELMPFYSFYKDEWNKVSYQDVHGVYPDQPALSWFVIYRDIFTVSEDMLVAPKLYINLPTGMLRVINNDTGQEVPRIFQKVAPYIYKKNKRGYTFFVEGRATDTPIPSGKWRIRLIGSMTPLPLPSKPLDATISYTAKEYKEHYIPNSKGLLCRYMLKCTDDHLASIQISTSTPDVYIKLQVLDNEKEIMSTEGKGHAVLPAVIFQKNPDELNRAGSRTSITKMETKTTAASTGTKTVTVKSTRRSSSAASQVSKKSATSEDEEEEKDGQKAHKYVIQALVLRNSWHLTEQEERFVEQLKIQEKEEMKANYDPVLSATLAQVAKERPGSPPKEQSKNPAAPAKGASSKAAKDIKPVKGAKDKPADKKEPSRPPSQQFELGKPNYLLRVVSEASTADDLEVRKDTSRIEEIRAMKRAWEEAEPGRAAKAIQSRMQYLNSHLLKRDTSDEEPKGKSFEEQTSAEQSQNIGISQSDSALDQGVGIPPGAGLSKSKVPTKEDLVPLDITPFIKQTKPTPILLDKEVMQLKQQEREQEMREFKMFWESVEQRRQEERRFRNSLKTKQLEMYTKMQIEMDKAREAINIPREAYRQKLLETERLKQEEIAAREAELQAEIDKSKPVEGKKSGKQPSAKKKK